MAILIASTLIPIDRIIAISPLKDSTARSEQRLMKNARNITARSQSKAVIALSRRSKTASSAVSV
jgi:hypothetical protein